MPRGCLEDSVENQTKLLGLLIFKSADLLNQTYQMVHSINLRKRMVTEL